MCALFKPGGYGAARSLNYAPNLLCITRGYDDAHGPFLGWQITGAGPTAMSREINDIDNSRLYYTCNSTTMGIVLGEFSHFDRLEFLMMVGGISTKLSKDPPPIPAIISPLTVPTSLLDPVAAVPDPCPAQTPEPPEQACWDVTVKARP